MKNNKRVFLLIEIILGIMVLVMASLMIREKNGEDLERISAVSYTHLTLPTTPYV